MDSIAELTEDMYSGLNILPLKCCLQLNSALFAHSVLSKLRLSQTVCQLNKEVHTHSTKTANKIDTKQYKSTKYGVNGAFNSICQAYNSLPSSVTSHLTPKTLKKAAANYFFNVK